MIIDIYIYIIFTLFFIFYFVFYKCIYRQTEPQNVGEIWKLIQIAARDFYVHGSTRKFAVGLLQKYLTVLDIHLNLNRYVQVCVHKYTYIYILYYDL